MAANDHERRTVLYVGDLHPDVTEKDLIGTFLPVAPLLSVYLCRDKFSPNYKSLCYAYVNFNRPCHALTAMKCLNHTPLKGKPIRIMWYERDPIARMNKNGNLFVKNLDKSVTAGRLEHVFSKYGTILSCKVAHEENGISKGFGFIQFDSQDSALAAQSSLDGVFLEGKKLYVSKLIRKDERNGAEVGFKRLIVKNLDKDITEDILKARFSEYGKVSGAVIMKDENGKSRRFGFVKFDSQEAAKRAMQFLNGEPLGSTNIVVARALNRFELRENSRQMLAYDYAVCCKELKLSNMFVKNPHEYVDGRKLMSGYGTVNSAITMWGGGVSRRFAYTCFPSPYTTNKALNSSTGANSGGRTPNVAEANPKRKQVIQMHNKPCVKFPPQPFYASNSQQPGFNFPYFYSPFSSVYRYVASSSNSSYPVTAQNMQMQGKSNALYVKMLKDEKPFYPVRTSGNAKELSKGPHPTCQKTHWIRKQ